MCKHLKLIGKCIKKSSNSSSKIIRSKNFQECTVSTSTSSIQFATEVGSGCEPDCVKLLGSVNFSRREVGPLDLLPLVISMCLLVG
jgi:hypothetical protein